MAPDTISAEQAGLRRAALMGAVAGLRSQMPLALLSRAVAQGEVSAPTGWLGTPLRSERGRQILLLSAVGEAIVDKTPLVAGRLSRNPFLGRLGFGAISAATLAQTQGTPVVQAALRGAAGAGIGSVVGYAFRVVVGRVTGLPDLVVALAEDAVAVGLARSAIRPEALAEMAEEMAPAMSAPPEPASAPVPRPDPAPATGTLEVRPVTEPDDRSNGTVAGDTAVGDAAEAAGSPA